MTLEQNITQYNYNKQKHTTTKAKKQKKHNTTKLYIIDYNTI